MKFLVIFLVAFSITVSADDTNLETGFDGALVDQNAPLDKVGDTFGTESCGRCDAAQRNQRRLTSTSGNSTSTSGSSGSSRGNE